MSKRGEVVPKARQLASKEANLFKQLVRFCENKQYKKAIKTADTILKKYPKHGETLTMKALTLHHMDKKTEAWNLAKKGVALDFESQICWHVLGLMHRREKNFVEAAKAYSRALKADSENVSLLRDLQLMYFLSRNLDGVTETGRKLCMQKPNTSQFWNSMAASLHLSGHPKVAADLLLVWISILVKGEYGTAKASVDRTHLHMYVAKLLEEGDGPDAALQHMKQYESMILDKTGMSIEKARIALAKGSFDEAAELYRGLIKNNPENLQYFEGLRAALQLPKDPTQRAERRVDLPANNVPSRTLLNHVTPALTEKQCQQWLKELDELTIPRSSLPRRLALRALSAPISDGKPMNDEFEKRLDAFTRPLLKKGVAALFASLINALGAEKLPELLKLTEKYQKSLKDNGKLLNDEENAAPAILFWVLYLRTNCLLAMEDYSAALNAVEEAIAHTPTCIDAHSLKARVLKRAGDLVGAYEAADHARELDLADRYLNNRAAKYAYRAGKPEIAAKLLAMFTRPGEDAKRYMHDMQCTWFELEAGECWLTNGQLGQALNHFLWVDRHRDDIESDQSDFFGYAFRKNTLLAFQEFTAVQDKLRQQIGWRHAAAGAIRAYLELAKVKAVADKEAAKEQAELDKLTPAERKKLLSKKRRAEAKNNNNTNNNNNNNKNKKNNNKNNNQSTPKNNSPSLTNAPPSAKALQNTSNPELEASNWALRLIREGGEKLDSHRLAIIAHTVARRFVLALRSAKRALELDTEGSSLTEREVIVLLATIDDVQSSDKPLNEKLSKLIVAARDSLKGSGKVTERLSALTETQRAEVQLYLAIARDQSINEIEKNASVLTKVVEKDATRFEAERYLKLLKSAKASDAVIEALRSAANKRFPLATAFHIQSKDDENKDDTDSKEESK